MNDNPVVACLDIGGTNIKSGLVGRDGVLVEDSRRSDHVDSRGTAASILGSFSSSLDALLTMAQAGALPLAGVCVAICGPFDLERGISKIKGVDKYEAIYDVNVKQHLLESLSLPENLPIVFDLDAWAFARGEVWKGAGQGFNRAIVFTLGTGVGSAFALDGQIVDEGEGVPWIGWISGQPYKDGILNDYVSSVYMIRQYQALTGDPIDLEEMAARARQGDVQAHQVYVEMATRLGEFVARHHAKQFSAECVIFGGQIARASDLFIDPFIKALGADTPVREVAEALDIENSALRGAAKLLFDTIDESIGEVTYDSAAKRSHSPQRHGGDTEIDRGKALSI